MKYLIWMKHREKGPLVQVFKKRGMKEKEARGWAEKMRHAYEDMLRGESAEKRKSRSQNAHAWLEPLTDPHRKKT